MPMSQRQRFLAILRGELPDKLPFLPRIELWHRAALSRGTLPDDCRNLSMDNLLRKLNLGIYGRQAEVVVRHYDGIQIVAQQVNDEIHTRYPTPFGTLRSVKKGDPVLAQAQATFITVEHPFKSPADYEALAYILDRVRFSPSYEGFLRQEAEIGPDGISRANVSPDPFFEIMNQWIGYEQMILELADNADSVMRLVEILARRFEAMQQIVLDSPALLVLTGANFTTSTTPPAMFREHFLPYYRDFNQRLIERGKWPMAHVDGEIGGASGGEGLMPLIAEAQFRIADAFTPPPVTSVSVRQAFQAWDRKIVLWGGIPSLMTSASVDDVTFEQFFTRLAGDVRPGRDPFIFGIGDTVAIDATFQRVAQMSELYHRLP